MTAENNLDTCHLYQNYKVGRFRKKYLEIT